MSPQRLVTQNTSLACKIFVEHAFGREGHGFKTAGYTQPKIYNLVSRSLTFTHAISLITLLIQYCSSLSKFRNSIENPRRNDTGLYQVTVLYMLDSINTDTALISSNNVSRKKVCAILCTHLLTTTTRGSSSKLNGSQLPLSPPACFWFSTCMMNEKSECQLSVLFVMNLSRILYLQKERARCLFCEGACQEWMQIDIVLVYLK